MGILEIDNSCEREVYYQERKRQRNVVLFMKKFIQLAFITSLFFFGGLSAAPPASPKYKLSIASVFQNEGPWMREWIEYHRIVGVEHFYLYNNESTDNFMEVLAPYIDAGLVTLIDWPDIDRANWPNYPYVWVDKTHAPAYKHACVERAKETEWLAMIDLDEFMVPAHDDTMLQVLDRHSDASAITLYWQIYGTSFIDSLPENALLIETLNRTALPRNPYHNILKTIIRPKSFKKFNCPPHDCVLVNPKEKTIQLTKKEAQLNHYLHRTVNYLVENKIKRREGMNGKKLTSQEIEALKNLGNDIDDPNKFIHRFLPMLQRELHKGHLTVSSFKINSEKILEASSL